MKKWREKQYLQDEKFLWLSITPSVIARTSNTQLLGISKYLKMGTFRTSYVWLLEKFLQRRKTSHILESQLFLVKIKSYNNVLFHDNSCGGTFWTYNPFKCWNLSNIEHSELRALMPPFLTPSFEILLIPQWITVLKPLQKDCSHTTYTIPKSTLIKDSNQERKDI